MHAGSARQPDRQASPSSPEIVMEVGAAAPALSPPVKCVSAGEGHYNHRHLYIQLDPLLKPGPAAQADGDCMYDSLRIELARNHMLQEDGNAWDVPSLRGTATQTAVREWEQAQGDEKERKSLEGKLLSIIEKQGKYCGSGSMDIDTYFRRMYVPCNPSRYKVKVPRGLRGIWGDSHMLHCIADALNIAVVTMTTSPFHQAMIFGKKGVSPPSQAPQCIVYLQYDGYSHYDTLVPKEGNAADNMVMRALAGDLPEIAAGQSFVPGLRTKQTRQSRLR